MSVVQEEYNRRTHSVVEANQKGVSIQEQIPPIETIEVMLYETGEDTYGFVRTLKRRELATPLVACSSHTCTTGGFPVQQEIRSMIQAGETQRVVTLTCTGHRVTGSVGEPCPNEGTFTIRINLKP